MTGKIPAEILVIGDSHTQVFTHPLFRTEFPEYTFNVINVGGATISGLNNPNSVSQALPIFRKAIKNSNASTAIVLLGEVDTGFVIWYRAEQNKVSVSAAMGKAIQNYTQLLMELSFLFKVVCISTPLPTIKDGNDWGDVANLRKEVKASQTQRTELTLVFNQRIKRWCEETGITYILLDPESLGGNGLVKDSFLNTDPNNHHYDAGNYSAMLVRHLKRTLNQRRSVFNATYKD